MCEDLYDEIILIHQAFPGIDLNDVNLETEFLGYRLSSPIVISAITGGTGEAKLINEKLAQLASRKRLALGLGSQRPILVNKSVEVLESYRIARRIARDVPVIGNIGLNTLNDLSFEDVEYLVNVIEADALAIHLNPAQEVIQPEGDTRFNDKVLDKLELIVKNLKVPVIVKEVGNGLSKETVETLYGIGIKFFDTAGRCGTNWIIIESHRLPNDSPLRNVASIMWRWGIPTPLSVIETRWAAVDATVIASGGVWDGLKAVKNIALGADLVGLAKPILEKLLKEGFESLERFIEEYVLTMKLTMFLMGARDVRDVHSKPVVLGEGIVNYMVSRGINYLEFINYSRRKIRR